MQLQQWRPQRRQATELGFDESGMNVDDVLASSIRVVFRRMKPRASSTV